MIPEIIHHIVGPNNNEVVDKCLSSWTILEKVGFKTKKWTDKSLSIFINRYYSFAFDAFINARNYAERADIGRYLLVYHYGGHYIDWDVQLLEPNLFLQICHEANSGYLIIDPINHTLASEAFSAKPKNGYLFHLVQDIIQIYNTKRRDDMGTPQYSGPYRMRDSLADYGQTCQLLLPVKTMFAYDYSEIREMPERIISQPMIHYWLHGWVK